MKHDWQNIDRQGTVGWHRCRACGLRRHFVRNIITDDHHGGDCKERQRDITEQLTKRVGKLLHDYDADTDQIRELLAKAIVKEKADSPYTRQEED